MSVKKPKVITLGHAVPVRDALVSTPSVGYLSLKTLRDSLC
jgi:hypothetical protein